MTRTVAALVGALFCVLGIGTHEARAECQIADAKLEEAILNSLSCVELKIARPCATYEACGTLHSLCSRMVAMTTANACWRTFVS